MSIKHLALDDEPDFLAGARPYQRDYLQKFSHDAYHFLEWEMGTGKTFTIIREACQLWWADQIDALVVIAPAGMYENWLDVEWPKHGLADVPIVPYVWRGKTTKADERARQALMKPEPDVLKVVVINMEAVSSIARRKKLVGPDGAAVPMTGGKPKFKKRRDRGKPTRGAEFLLQFVKGIDNQRTLLVFDESEHLSNASNRTIQVLKVAEHCHYRRALSGTAVRNTPFDLYYQFEFLRQGITGCRNLHIFKHRYGIWEKQYTNAGDYDALVEFKNLDELKELRESLGTTVRKKDLPDQLPPKQFVTRNVELSPEQRKAYVEMRKALLTELDEGQIVTAKTALVKLLRLHQIVLGHVTTESGKVTQIKHGRIDALLEILRESGYAPAVIWCHSVPAIKEVSQALADHPEIGHVANYYGDTPKDLRPALVQAFQEGEVQYLVANPAIAGYGLTLTRAELMIYYANSYKLTERLQSEDRAHRIGLDHPVLYVDMVAKGTVDQKVLEAIEKKINIAAEIGVCYRDLIEG